MSKRDRISKISLVAIVSILFVSTFMTTTMAVRAYNNYQTPACTWPYAGGSNLLKLYWREHPTTPPPGDYATAFSIGMADWYAVATPIDFDYLGVSTSLHAADYYGMPDLGLTSVNCGYSGGVFQVLNVTIAINRNHLDNQGWHKLQVVTSHELGHHATAGHSTASVSTTLMRGTYNTSQPTTPQFDDTCAINTRYSSTSWPATGC